MAEMQLEVPVRHLSDDELLLVIAAHEGWLAEEESKEWVKGMLPPKLYGFVDRRFLGPRANKKFAGRRADLSNVDLRDQTDLLRGRDLSRAILTGANLRSCDLTRCKLTEADLSGASLRHACLVEAKLSDSILNDADCAGADLTDCNLYDAQMKAASLVGSNLRRTKLPGADLREADLTDTKHLEEEQLAGTHLGGALLPAGVGAFEGLAKSEKLIENSGKILLALLAAAVYSLFTVAGTTDAALVSDTGTNKLPVLGSDVPISIFFIVGPLVLFFGYCYLHLTLQSLWVEIARLPVVFPNFRQLPDRLPPWLLGDLVRAYSPHLRSLRPTHALILYLLGGVLAWLTTPLTIAYFWWRYLPRQEPFRIWGLVALTTVVIYLCIVFISITMFTLNGLNLRLNRAGPEQTFRRRFSMVMLGFFALLITSFFGYRLVNFTAGQLSANPLGLIRLNLSEAELSVRPPGWDGKDLARIKGIDLRGDDLRYADATRAFLVNAHLQEANLANANFKSADLRGAQLMGVDGSDAGFSEADIREASFSPAPARAGVNREPRSSTLRKASFGSALLDGAKFISADLSESDFGSARQSNPNGALLDFSGSDLRKARFKNADLRGADFNSADLQEANLEDADLRGADLSFAELAGANIGGANLTGARFDPKALKRATYWKDAYFADADCRRLGIAPMNKERTKRRDQSFPSWSPTRGFGGR